MPNLSLEDLLIEQGAPQGLIWEVRHLINGPSQDYTRLHKDELALYIFKDSPWYLYFIPMFDSPYKGMINRLSVTEHLKDMPLYLIEHGSISILIEEALRLLHLPEGLIFHIINRLGLTNNLYITRLELSVAWGGGEFVTFIDSGSGAWEMKIMHLDTLISIREHLPAYVQEILINLLQCPLPLNLVPPSGPDNSHPQLATYT